MSGAGFVTALGVMIILLSVVGKLIYLYLSLKRKVTFFSLGFIGAYKNRLSLLQIFIGSLFIILLLQLIAAIVGFTLRNRAETQLRTTLLKSLESYGTNADIRNEWDYLQQRWSCCGVGNATDWIDPNKQQRIPCSCYADKVCPPSETGYFARGCYGSALDLYFRYSKALGGVSLFFFFVEVIGLILAILLLRDLKNNYGSV